MLAYLHSVSRLLALILQSPGQSRAGQGLECLLPLRGALAREPVDARGWEEGER